MFTRCFERTTYNIFTNADTYQVINISEYGFEFYMDNEFESAGLVEDLDEIIEMLLDEGWEEVL